MPSNPVDFLQVWAQDITEKIRENLVAKDSWFDRSQLAQSIVALPVETTSEGYVLKIQMAEYGQFVDEGRGASEKGLISPVEKIEDWITRRGINVPVTVTLRRKNSQGVMRKITRNYVNKMESRRSMAFAIATKHKDKGFTSKGLGFYSEIINDNTLNKLTETLADEFGESFIAEIVE